MREQCKAYDSKALNEVWTGKRELDGWVSPKYDGHYVQIHITASDIRFFTSGGKEFTNSRVASIINAAWRDTNMGPCILEAEYLGDSEGKHGDRSKAAVITTLRKEFKSGVSSKIGNNHKLRIFDYISYKVPFSERLENLSELRVALEKLGDQVSVVNFTKLKIDDILSLRDKLVADGYEGLMYKEDCHVHVEGKRVKTALKFKTTYKAILKCIDFYPGNGKYSGMVGSLLCEDHMGVRVYVGSGLTDEDRMRTNWIGKSIRISYESFKDTYIHPIYKGVIG